jgi:CheY-like chemotaxis protein
MSRRVVLLEPDASGRAVMARVLSSEGYVVDAVVTLAEVRACVAGGAPVDLLVVDELGGRAAMLEDVRALRRELPAIPLIVTGSLLSPRVLRELIRLGVADALSKPFTPDDLREACRRALDRGGPHHAAAVEHAAGVEGARRAIAEGRLADALPALRRALSVVPLDPEVTALLGLAAELEGRDADADRAYRAAIALRLEEDVPAPDPHEALARLSAYGAARPARALDREGAPIWVVTDSVVELAGPSPTDDASVILLLPLGLTAEGAGALYLRDAAGARGFALMAGGARPEPIAAAARRLRGGALVAAAPTREALDLPEIEALRRASCK